ncbi:MAG: type II toxin-antitoxin system Phd/YefM family antitoxin [Verrucomicrobia bacterium]|nr:type II toxin-antitoxin system Phd/YefM family antitoxin [Verrucomicrobiota bacterium]
MKSTYSITQAQSKLPGLVREVSRTGGAYGIRVHDEVKAYLISRERMERITETLEILANPAAAGAIRDYQAGATRFSELDALNE